MNWLATSCGCKVDHSLRWRWYLDISWKISKTHQLSDYCNVTGGLCASHPVITCGCFILSWQEVFQIFSCLDEQHRLKQGSWHMWRKAGSGSSTWRKYVRCYQVWIVTRKTQNIIHNFTVLSVTVSFCPFSSCSQSILNVCPVLVGEDESQVCSLFTTNSSPYELLF